MDLGGIGEEITVADILNGLSGTFDRFSAGLFVLARISGLFPAFHREQQETERLGNSMLDVGQVVVENKFPTLDIHQSVKCGFSIKAFEPCVDYLTFLKEDLSPVAAVGQLKPARFEIAVQE